MSPKEPGETDFTQQGRTFRIEALRSLPQGFVETAGTTYAMYVAIRVFDLSPWMKGAIIASGSVGLLLNLFLVQWVRRWGWTVNRVAAGAWLLGAAGFAIAAACAAFPLAYGLAVCLAFMAAYLASPLMAEIYRKHYADDRRGRLFSWTTMSRAAVTAGSGVVAGIWLEKQGFAPLFVAYAVASVAMAACVMAMAPVRLRASRRIRWFDAFRHVGGDPPFRKLLVVWMLLGLGNLISGALFVEFISNPDYGFGYDARSSGWITSTIPMLAFIGTVVAWGWVFDRMPFYTVRLLVNLFFIAGILIYFSAGGPLGLCVGIGLHGIASSGGTILWTLWTTRFAPADRLMEYQSVHGFLTGVRGVLAPLIAFGMAGNLGPETVGWLSSGLLVAATLMIAPEIRQEWRGISQQRKS
ncbi:MAG: hypothetical protein MUF31_07375 [Akkermansiaceae bacterium]|nr:hypothetical protein [Akkermansiaceae bacterium]